MSISGRSDSKRCTAALAFTVDKWQYVGQSIFARRTYSGSTVSYGDTVSEQTTFTLRHTPE